MFKGDSFNEAGVSLPSERPQFHCLWGGLKAS